MHFYKWYGRALPLELQCVSDAGPLERLRATRQQCFDSSLWSCRMPDERRCRWQGVLLCEGWVTAFASKLDAELAYMIRGNTNRMLIAVKCTSCNELSNNSDIG